MAIIGQYFPGQTPSEQVFLVLRRSVITYLAYLGILFVMILPFFILLYYLIKFPEFAQNEAVADLLTLAGSAYLLFILGLLLYGFVDHYLDVYIITNERIVDIKQTGFFRREIAELHLREVQDVSARVNGFLPTMFHYGDIFIQTAGERENFIFYAVPHPYRVSKKIADLHQAQLEKIQLRSDERIEKKLEEISTKSSGDTTRYSAENFAISNPPSAEVRLIDPVAKTGAFLTSSKKQLTAGDKNRQKYSSEYYTEHGLSDITEEEIIPETFVSGDGFGKIDKYVNEISDQYDAQDAEEVELKEGEVKKIDD